MVLPLLLLIVLGCLDMGRALYTWMAVANASREGARYACLSPNDTSGIIAQAKDDISAEGLSVSSQDLQVQVSAPLGQSGGSPVIVTVTYRLPLITSFLFRGQALTIKAATQMVIVGGT